VIVRPSAGPRLKAGPSSVGPLLLVLVSLCACIASALLLPLRVGILGVLLIGVCVGVVLNYRCAVLQVRPQEEALVLYRGWLWTSVFRISLSQVRVAVWEQGPWGRALGFGTVRVYLLSGRRRVFVAWAVCPVVWAELCRSALRTPAS
jgi:membrane protein YdbS with pleckstrin-like domain